MSLAIVYSRAALGMTAPLVSVEVHISNGMAGLHIVGLPQTTVRESKDRVRSALLNTNFEFPCRRITVNLAPADLPKVGGRFDLPIAIGILVASGQLPQEISVYEFIGELALSGELRAVRGGVLPILLGVERANRQLIIPLANAHEAGLAKNTKVWVAQHFLEVCAHLKNEKMLPSCTQTIIPSINKSYADLSEVKGQPHAKRALEIAAAGKHSLIFIGPPGTGKTMLATRLPGILPELEDRDALEIAAISSISDKEFNSCNWKKIPFRAPHHTCSNIALVGGGRPPKPGEISLAHHGILFLDELPEFQRNVLESLREPMESGNITISRAAFQIIFPAKFQFIGAMNPCPCGYANQTENNCRCSEEQIKKYLSKISGPLLNRIDMHVAVNNVHINLLHNNGCEEKSDAVKQRIIVAQEIQKKRQAKLNRDLNVTDLESVAQLDALATELLNQISTKFKFSARVYHRLIKIARTIADLAAHETINQNHLAEALTFRCLDKIRFL